MREGNNSMKKNHLKLEVPAEEANEMLEEAQEVSKGKRIANAIINVILVVAIVIAALCTYTSYVSTSGNGVPNVFGVRILSIQTESMYPTLKPGDMIFDAAVKDTSKLQIGDVITYWTVINGERVLNTHRITEIYDGGGYLIFETKGDNNTAADPLTVHEAEIVGQWNGAKIEGLGKVFDYLQTSTGFLVVVVIPVALFFIFHLIQFFRVLFEYNNLKNKLLYEQERGRNEDYIEKEKQRIDETRRKERERMEAELREKLRAELLASGAAPQISSAEETVAGEAEQENPAENEEQLAEKAATAQKAAERAEMEARIRAEMEAEAKAKAEAEAAERRKAEERAKMEAEIRAQIKAEMEAKTKEETGEA